METKKLPCSCKHEFQDKAHGKGVRVHNPTMKAGVYRCAVCGSARTE